MVGEVASLPYTLMSRWRPRRYTLEVDEVASSPYTLVGHSIRAQAMCRELDTVVPNRLMLMCSDLSSELHAGDVRTAEVAIRAGDADTARQQHVDEPRAGSCTRGDEQKFLHCRMFIAGMCKMLMLMESVGPAPLTMRANDGRRHVAAA